jgi:transcriptional regulator of acetoin/glycerol metabolism
MDRFGGNLSMVAKLLNISRPTLYAKLKKYDI